MSKRQTNDETFLLQDAKAGDAGAFDELVRRTLPQVYGTVLKMIRHEADAWDASQDAFISAWKALDRFKGESRFSTWVTSIAVRKALDRIRAEKKTSELTEASGMENENRVDAAEQKDLAKSLHDAVLSLPEPERIVYAMHEESGMKYREIAAELNLPIGTVMSRIHAARLRLRESLKDWWEAIR